MVLAFWFSFWLGTTRPVKSGVIGLGGVSWLSEMQKSDKTPQWANLTFYIVTLFTGVIREVIKIVTFRTVTGNSLLCLHFSEIHTALIILTLWLCISVYKNRFVWGRTIIIWTIKYISPNVILPHALLWSRAVWR